MSGQIGAVDRSGAANPSSSGEDGLSVVAVEGERASLEGPVATIVTDPLVDTGDASSCSALPDVPTAATPGTSADPDAWRDSFRGSFGRRTSRRGAGGCLCGRSSRNAGLPVSGRVAQPVEVTSAINIDRRRIDVNIGSAVAEQFGCLVTALSRLSRAGR